MSVRTVSIAVIGCGHWGPNHIRNFQSIAGVRVVAVVDADETRLNAVKALFPNLRTVTSAEAVLSDPDVDAIVAAILATSR